MKTLLFDIETAPNLAWVWGKWEQNVIEFEKEFHILCFAYKWLGEKTEVRAITKREDDKKIVKELWDLFNEADVIIAHNGAQFDIKKVNTRFAFHGLKPPAPYKTIDTKKVAKKYFGFNSNSMNDLGVYLGLGQKVDTGGFKLWKGCMSNDKNSWQLMKQYNKHDVDLLEKVYLFFRPWIGNHPTVGMYTEGSRCAHCGSQRLQKRGQVRNKTTAYQNIWCKDCEGWNRGHLNIQEVKPLIAI